MGSNGLRFEALGALRVTDDIEVAITRPARRRILSILLLDRGRDVSVPRLIDRMWGDGPPGAPRNTLQAHVAGLRRQLGHVIQSTAAGYRIDVAAHWFDVEEFERRAAQMEHCSDDEETVAAAEDALRLWRGDPFPDLAGDDYARGAVGALVETRRRVEMRRLEALLAAGRAEEALSDLERLVTEQPYEERFWELLILARYRIGNTAGALRAFQTVRAVLGEELGIEPGTRLQDLEERILLHDPSLGSQPGAATPHNLPASTSSFVGRGRDVDAVSGLLKRHRLVTVTGGPGLGKTRFVLEVGNSLRESFPGGVWLVRLAGARTEDDVTATIAAAVGLMHDVFDAAELGVLVSARPQLVILDNCEHVLDHVRPFVLACLEHDGPARILTTSRRRLGLGAEQVWRLEPLDLPSAVGDDVYASDSVRLLVDRARAVDRSFRVEEVSPSGLVALVRHTDGIPLALELAASWLPSIGVDEAISVAGIPAPDAMDDLDDHHRSMRSAVDWSFALLASPDRPLAAAASVFNGSFVLDAFRTVCAPDLSRADAAAAVSRLVESSLVTAERQEEGSLRYRMLEPVREFGHEHLVEIGIHPEVHTRHARWYLDRAVALGEIVDRETDPADAQAVIDDELADHRAAMRWMLDTGDHEGVASLATALTGFWFARYLGSEAIRWLDDALTGSMCDTVRVGALWTAGWAAYSKADYAAATLRYEQCRTLAEEIGDRAAEGRALFGLGRIELPRNPEVGHRHMRDALQALSDQPGTLREQGDCLVALGISASMGGRVHEARSYLGDARSIMEKCGSLRSLSIIHRYLSLAAWYDADAEAARHHVELAVRLARRSDDRPAIGGSLIQTALVETRWGDLARAATAMLEAIGQLPPRNEIDHCLVFVGVVPVLVGADHHEKAARLLDHIDRVYAEYGWVPVDTRMPAVAEFRAALGGVGSFGPWNPVASAEMASIIRPLLEELAG